MKYDKYAAVASLKPTSKWRWAGEDYSGLRWLSSDTKPTETEINSEVARLTNA